MDRIRLLFEKKGRAVYISHLDLMRTLQRAFARADLPLLYSEGFNPHPQISILLPLSVGAASECEILEFRLKNYVNLNEIAERLNPALPEGVRVLSAYEAQEKVKFLKYLRIEGRLEYDNSAPSEKAEQLSSFFAQKEIVIIKRTKKGEGESDIAPAIKEISFKAAENYVNLNALISAQEPTLNPENLINALRQLAPKLAPDFAQFTRLEVYHENMEIFR